MNSVMDTLSAADSLMLAAGACLVGAILMAVIPPIVTGRGYASFGYWILPAVFALAGVLIFILATVL